MADGLLNKASIILTPTGYKAGTLYNVAPVVEPYEDFDFARASTATRINSSGLVEMVGRTLGSELMPSVATIVNVGGGSITQISSNSYSSTSDGTTGSSLRPKFDFNTTSGKTYKLVITPTGTITGTVNFDFYDGSSYLFQNYDFTTTKEIYFTDNGSVFGGFDGTKTYSIASFTISVKEVIDTNNIPRISYDSNGDNGHILLEPTSTNLLSYSQEFDHSSGYWNKANTTIETTTIVSPDGSSNTYKLFATTSTSSHFTDYDSYTGASSGQTYTFSLFVKSAGSDFVQLASSSGFPARYQNFNLSTGAKASGDISNATIEAYPNGWYRISVTETTNGTSRRFLIVPVLTDAARNPSFAGNAQEDGVYIFGAQLEEQSHPTSYIPTLTGSQEVRATETATGAGSATLINSTEGVLYAEIAALANDGTNRTIALNKDTNDRIQMYFNTSTNGLSIFYKAQSGATSFIMNETLTDATTFNKIAFKWKTNDFALWVNGVETDTVSSGVTPTANSLNALEFEMFNNSSPFYGKCKALAVFNEALSDAELNNLTG